jgi:NhaA family Na+:H+ antiporter
VRNAIVYFLIGTFVWLAFLKSGVHATLASVLMAMTIPARTRIEGERLASRVCDAIDELRSTGLPRGKGLLTNEQQHALHAIEKTLEDASPPLQQLEHALMPLVTFLVMPVFALANAGVRLGGGIGDALVDPICIGVILGLFVGKQVGILTFSWLGVRLGIADLPSGVTWRQIHAVGVLAGIGFTMSLFIGGLAFDDPSHQEIAKVGILLGSILSGVVGSLLLLRSRGGSSHPG